MSFLINRNPPGRLICLHSLLTYLNNQFNTGIFNLNDLKYNPEYTYNIHQTCPLLIKSPSVTFKVCPYLENPISKAKCYLTQSVLQKDTQKSKSVSDTFNALEGLGFIKRVKDGGIITESGRVFISDKYESKNTLPRLREGLLSYGPFIGFLHEISSKKGCVYKSGMKLGYPLTNERINDNGMNIPLSTGSTNDTVTRTRSVLFIWATTAGFLLPYGMKKPTDPELWHVEMLRYIKLKRWPNKYLKIFSESLFTDKIYVDNPLSYDAMTKSTSSLRERNQKEEREITLKYESLIKNRRFALVYGLAKKSEYAQSLSFYDYLKELENYPDFLLLTQMNSKK